MDIRCDNKKFGEVSENSSGILRVFCKDRFCKRTPSEVVVHVFDLAKLNADGKSVKLIDTRRFKDPTKGNRT